MEDRVRRRFAKINTGIAGRVDNQYVSHVDSSIVHALASRCLLRQLCTFCMTMPSPRRGLACRGRHTLERSRRHGRAAPLLSLFLLLLLTAACPLPAVAVTKPPPFDTEALVSRLAAKAAGPVTAKLADEVRAPGWCCDEESAGEGA